MELNVFYRDKSIIEIRDIDGEAIESIVSSCGVGYINSGVVVSMSHSEKSAMVIRDNGYIECLNIDRIKTIASERDFICFKMIAKDIKFKSAALRANKEADAIFSYIDDNKLKMLKGIGEFAYITVTLDQLKELKMMFEYYTLEIFNATEKPIK